MHGVQLWVVAPLYGVDIAFGLLVLFPTLRLVWGGLEFGSALDQGRVAEDIKFVYIM